METKQVIVVRKDLEMSKGKLGAQVSHASLDAFLNRKLSHHQKDGLLVIPMTDAMTHWMNNSFAKVVLRVESEEELLKVYEEAKKLELPCSLIKDEGRTKFHGVSTYTCAAVGPDWEDKINLITGHLKLL